LDTEVECEDAAEVGERDRGSPGSVGRRLRVHRHRCSGVTGNFFLPQLKQKRRAYVPLSIVPTARLAATFAVVVVEMFRHVPSITVREIAAKLKAIYAGEDVAAAWQKAVQLIEKLARLRLDLSGELVEAALEETLIYQAFSGGALGRCIRTNN